MAHFDPELIDTMRHALDDLMATVPVDQASPAVKACVAEYILKIAAQGVTTYDAIVASVGAQLQSILMILT